MTTYDIFLVCCNYVWEALSRFILETLYGNANMTYPPIRRTEIKF